MPPREHRRKIQETILYRAVDKLTEILIYFMVIFTPWAFGTTETWSIWTMNISSYALGLLLVIKFIIRLTTKHNTISDSDKRKTIKQKKNRPRPILNYCNILLAVFIIILLGYILISAFNARGLFDLASKKYTYFEQVNKNLPHSYDSNGTWFLFWQYLGIVILFWAIRDYIKYDKIPLNSIFLNYRLKKIIYILCLNGGVLSLLCILQRIYYEEQIGKLLFVLEPGFNKSNINIFGPFAYRSNASTYLNLIWPLGLGLLIQESRICLELNKKRFGSGIEILLIPCIVITACGPIISSSRSGSFIMLFLMALSILILVSLNIKSKFLFFSLFLILFLTLFTANYFGWERIKPRFEDLISGDMSGRAEIYSNVINMISEYGVFGSGPGSFPAIYQFESKNSSWDIWAHNDYLEFYLTFGLIGTIFMILNIITLAFWFIYNFNHKYNCIFYFSLISLAGVIVHALVDFPLQVYSILVLLAIISSFLTINFSER